VLLNEQLFHVNNFTLIFQELESTRVGNLYQRGHSSRNTLEKRTDFYV